HSHPARTPGRHPGAVAGGPDRAAGLLRFRRAACHEGRDQADRRRRIDRQPDCRHQRTQARRNSRDRRPAQADARRESHDQKRDEQRQRRPIMNISEAFIRRPVMTTLSSLAIVLFGLMAYRYLPVNDLPNVDFPTIVVSASLPGASPETMASSVATPLEKQFSTIAGLDSMTSSNMQGSTNITLQFNLTRNIDAGAQDVQAAIAATQAQLPLGMPSPPSYRKVNPAD